MNRSTLIRLAGSTLAVAVATTGLAATPAELEAAYRGTTSGPAAPDRGERLFTSPHGGEWSCATCHGVVPTKAGRHAATGKSIAPLAPASNPERFVDAAKTEKWFRRNCNEVMGRECSAAEKADVISWLRTLR